jgi:hypothetical protein
MRTITGLALSFSLAALGCVGTHQCPAPTTDCFDICVNLQTDPGNCGGCNVVCGQGVACLNGVCSTACPANLSLCPDQPARCADLSNSPRDCGRCGVACAAGVVCQLGQCGGPPGCPVGFTRCGDLCADLTTDVANCGACNRPCGLGATCVASQCQTSPPG